MSQVVAEAARVLADRLDLSSITPAQRVASVDFMRGLVLVVMAIDHLRDFLTSVPFDPGDIAHTYPALFFTRWITHFWAPWFFFLAGTGARLLLIRGGSFAATSRFLWTRGLWLILLEFTVIEYAWTFVFWQMGGVIWSIGCCMILLAFLARLPDQSMLAVGFAIVLPHDLFDRMKPAQLGSFDWLWSVLHHKGVVPHTHLFVLFPLLPLLGVMALGYVFGKVFEKPAMARARFMLWLGSASTAAFLMLRGFNRYGNPTAGVAGNSPGEWHVQGSFIMSVVSFLDVEKYPASLQYLLMTIGPGLVLFSFVERNSSSQRFLQSVKPLIIFGRVPLLFYVLHLYAIHFAAIGPAYWVRQPVAWLSKGTFWMNEVPSGYGHGLPLIYGVWIVLMIVLYFPCACFADYRRHRAWWLSYL